jgi:hypothetical protein
MGSFTRNNPLSMLCSRFTGIALANEETKLSFSFVCQVAMAG